MSTNAGIVRLRALAVFRLITNWNLVGCSTGRSAGLAPFRIFIGGLVRAGLLSGDFFEPCEIRFRSEFSIRSAAGLKLG
jgi:hypothetical protein